MKYRVLIDSFLLIKLLELILNISMTSLFCSPEYNMAEIEFSDGIFTLYLPKTFTFDIIASIHSCLSRVEDYNGPCSLIITSRNSKIFSGGMDIKFLMDNSVDVGFDLFKSLMKLFGRLLKFGVPTIVAIKGHVIAGGLILALACDYRIMNNNAGTAKMTEINLGIPLPRGGSFLLKTKLSPDVYRDFVLKGKSFTPAECYERRVVDYAVPENEVIPKATELAKELMKFGENKLVYSMLKKSMYFDESRLAEEAAYRQDEVESVVSPKL